jgi:hypothetical protein
MSLWSRLTNVFRSDRLEQDLDDEQRFHIEARADELEAQGLSREAALEQAARQFGHRLQLRESSRDVKLAPWVDSLWRDLRFGQRLLRKDAALSAAAIVSLGLAIGACTAAFSLVDALILRKLPVRDPDTLVYLDRTGKSNDGPSTPTLSYPLFDRIRQVNTLLRERLLAVLSGFFATLGLVLAAVGLYGVLSYAVVRRTREIGIRLTLGAQPAAVVRSVIGRITMAVCAGVLAGLPGGVYFATFVRTFLYEVEPFRAVSFVLPVLGLLAAGFLAAWFPARRATRVDPVEALRVE